MSLRRRVIAGVSAGAYGQIVSLGLQLATVPIFLSRWTLEEYGLWLIISAAQTYFALSEFGVVSAAGSRMTVLVGRGAYAGANAVFRSAISFIAATMVCLLLISPLLIFAFASFGLPFEFAIAGGILLVNVAVAQIGGLSFIVYQSTSRNHRGLTSIANIRITEWAFGIVLLFVAGSPILVASAMLVGRLVATLFALRGAMQGQSTFRLALGSWRILRLHLPQASANFTISLASSLSLQGVTILIGIFYGAADVAVFNTYRTAARLVVQVTATLSHAAWPEFSDLRGRGDFSALRTLYRRIQSTSLLASAFISAAFVIALPLILDLWTHGAVPVSWPLGIAIACYAFLASSWHVPRVLLTAVGDNVLVAKAATVSSVFVSVASATMGLLEMPIFTQAVAMGFGELASSAFAVVAVRRWLQKG